MTPLDRAWAKTTPPHRLLYDDHPERMLPTRTVLRVGAVVLQWYVKPWCGSIRFGVISDDAGPGRYQRWCVGPFHWFDSSELRVLP